MKIIKSLKDSGLLIKRVIQSTENETKEYGRRFHDILLHSLGAGLLRNMLTGKSVIRAGDGVIQAGEGVFESKQDFQFCFIL